MHFSVLVAHYDILIYTAACDIYTLFLDPGERCECRGADILYGMWVPMLASLKARQHSRALRCSDPDDLWLWLKRNNSERSYHPSATKMPG